MIGHPAPAWLVNYADLMTELVCFFIVLYALSAALSKDVQKAKKEVEEAMKQEEVAGQVKVDKDGMQITIQEQGENVFFNSGSSDLSPRMVEVLAKIAPTLKNLAKEGHDIVVEGHTDNVPLRRSGRFASNWELSTGRATNVVQHMIRNMGFPPEHMAAIGYGEFHPLVANDTDEHRASNRRVVFFVKNKPPNFDKGKEKEGAKSKEKEEAAKPEAAAETTPSSESSSEESTSSEPSVDSALAVPAQVQSE